MDQIVLQLLLFTTGEETIKSEGDILVVAVASLFCAESLRKGKSNSNKIP
jgi:hypothetical protein